MFLGNTRNSCNNFDKILWGLRELFKKILLGREAPLAYLTFDFNGDLKKLAKKVKSQGKSQNSSVL